ncbi:uncharacterized protein F4807DRAFT_92884 [Annulohypoxylon truncatum]|uniref:uncharacterized protein n=1 Tax=Annulohypoxylon truncatum TaxID=327061 RepID=UPI0020089429|nr:uncharacterized protein F4807DRAFT_92884 [Annulohypoxylon truncatum]KAI1209417.1 hypothetical protein F4807DRAFT_92884 [Annulohypoxylon truncatum]
MDISTTHSTLTTIGGWAVMIGLGGLFWYRSKQKQLQKRTERRGSFTRQSGKQNEVGLGSDAKKKTEKPAKPKPKPKAPADAPTQPAPSNIDYNREQVEAADKKADREFARQLSTTHAGTKFNTKKSDEKKQKSVKQSKAQEISEAQAGKISVPSSHAGDADDDLSSQASPVVVPADSRDVSDMLEPTAPGPSVLRLTDVDSAKKPKERKQKAPEVVETKKQRQNRKKAEAAKAAREEEEKERKVKLEQQRRTARIAEGRAAKDGSTFAANTQNAWNGKPTNGDNNTVQPLDTFDEKPKAEPAKAAKPVATKAAEPIKEKADPWISGVPSEEEQMEMLRQEDSWNEVKTKKKGKKKDVSGETSTPSAPATNGGSTPTAKPSAPVNGTNKKPILTSSNSSFAALTPEETDDNDEEEWDV